MLNAPELPNAPMTRWLAYVKLFDFDIVHVPAKDHTIPDALSRKENGPEDDEVFDADEVADDDLGIWNLQLEETGKGVSAMPLPNRVWIIEELYQSAPEWLALAKYLEEGVLDETLSPEDRKNIRRRAPGFFVRNGRLFQRSKRGIPREVILDKERQDKILEATHEEAGHRGRDACIAHIRERFWWPKLYESIRDHIRSCDPCQRRHNRKEKEPSRATAPSRLFQKTGVDLVHLGEGSGPYPYLIVARDDLSNWVEARELRNKTSHGIKEFIERDILARYGPVMSWIATDNGGEMKKETSAYLKKLHIPVVTAAAYHPQANGMIERGHGPLVEACLKIAGEAKNRHLPAALWADRITTRRTTGVSPFELPFGAAPLLPVDVELGSLRTGGRRWIERSLSRLGSNR